jgi:polysaccharide biosynthesis/export protein
MQPIRILILSLATLALTSCASWQPPWQTATTPEADKTPTGSVSKSVGRAPRNETLEYNDAYKLDSGDRVRIVVSGQDWLSNSYEVDASGAIEIPSHGKITARGLNTVRLSSAIAKRLKQDKLREAQVAVQVETYRPFTIRGEVANPGQYPYVNNMTTETAIAIAGGLKPGADKKNVTINNAEKDETGTVSSRPDSPVRPGDTVTVTEER